MCPIKIFKALTLVQKNELMKNAKITWIQNHPVAYCCYGKITFEELSETVIRLWIGKTAIDVNLENFKEE